MVVTGAASEASGIPFLYLAQRTLMSLTARLGNEAVFHRGGQVLLGVLFSCRLAGCLKASTRNFMLKAMEEVGAALDKATEEKLSKPEAITKNDVDLTVVDLPDRFVLFKPPHWEVHNENMEQQLSHYAKAACGNAPIFGDDRHNNGFLHRLDVPSSGLILVAKTYKAFYDLQVQLHAGEMHRDYTVLCHGLLPRTLTEVTASLVPGETGPTISGRGKMSSSKISLIRHYAKSLSGAALSHVLLSIDTGRKHQIRSHLTFVGHPTVRDGLYTSIATYTWDECLCSRNWLHRHRLVFQDASRQMREVFSELPPDLELPEDGGSEKRCEF